MSEYPVTFQRLYRDHAGLEYSADAAVVERVLASMNASAGGDCPFKVRFRFSDGRVVVAAAKRGRP